MTTTSYSYVSHLRSQGREEVRQEGRAEGKAETLVQVLRGRGVEVPEADYQQIMACRDSDILTGWLSRAAQVATADELLAGPAD